VTSSESLADARLLLLSVRNADKVPRPGDASPVQAHEHSAVGLVDAPAFVHKAEILTARHSSCWSAQGINTLERFLAPQYYSDGTIMATVCMSCFFVPDGGNSRITCTWHVVELADPQENTFTVLDRCQSL
jgi:hypothetical protein